MLAIFALVLSFKAGSIRGKSGTSILFAEPADMELTERVRAHQDSLEYVPMIVILMGAIELNDGSAVFFVCNRCCVGVIEIHARDWP